MSGLHPYVPRASGSLDARQPYQVHWRDELRIWWREIDRVMLGLVLCLLLAGTVAVGSASPASAERLSTTGVQLDEFLFLKQHLLWQALGLSVLFATSLLSRDSARRLGIVLAASMLALLVLVPFIGAEVNGARRWINLGMRFQPSEFLKPGFAILLAWILTWRLRDPALPVIACVTGIMGLVALLLMMQPNLGDTLLFAGVWFVLVLLSGVSVQRISALVGFGIAALTATYFLYDNARHRIDAFLGGGTAFDQVDLAERTLLAGGWTGSGMWLGVRKMSLPEAHTDYIFSVIGEEFGLLACLLVVLLYLGLMLRVLLRLFDEENLFALLAGAGLIAQIGGQAMINILVNLQLFPSKGMTLPLVSYGGSSTIAVCMTVGLLLAITRRNPYLKPETPGLMALLGQRDEAA